MQTTSPKYNPITPADTIFTTGAFVEAIKVSINGKEQYRWLVTSFEDDSFYNGEYINPYVHADTLEGMFVPDEE